MKFTIENLTKTFDGGNIVAVDGVDLEVKDGEITVLLGPSGCGKSTILRCIAGLETPDSGKIYMDGEDITGWSPAERDIGFVFQERTVYPHMTVWDNLAFPLKRLGMEEEERERRIREVTELLRINKYHESKPTSLSGGEIQRVALGSAIVRDPNLFLLDEPFTGLDAKLRKEMRTEVSKLQNKIGVTTIHVTHNQEEAMSIGDRIAVMKAGEIQQVGKPTDVYNEPNNLFVGTFVGSPSMNIFEIKLKNGKAVHSNFEYELPEKDAEKVKERDELLLGIRPEHLRLEEGGPIEAEVILAEELGERTVVYMDIGGQEVTVVLRSMEEVEKGNKVRIAPRPNQIHLFEKETGERL